MPKWLEKAVFYEIYPQSFCDTNADGIGDLPGIIRKLDYIRDLGFNALWINPCFLSPFGDAGYDVADYCQVAPRYGTNEDLKQLFSQAHQRGMHVLLDLVPGHTSVEHPWFKESVKPERNAFSDRYVWTDSVWNSPEGMGCLRGISQRDGSCALNFFSCQPALNYGFYNITQPWQQSPEDEGPKATLQAMEDVMAFWLEMGCDGFRVDMAGSLVKNDPDSEGTIALWQKVRKFLDERFPEAAIISEWGEPDKSLRGGFHMDFLLHFGPSRPGGCLCLCGKISGHRPEGRKSRTDLHPLRQPRYVPPGKARDPGAAAFGIYLPADHARRSLRLLRRRNRDVACGKSDQRGGRL